MVVASTLAFLAVNNKLYLPTPDGSSRRITKGELVSMAVENEKRVGVNSGGYATMQHNDSSWVGSHCIGWTRPPR